MFFLSCIWWWIRLFVFKRPARRHITKENFIQACSMALQLEKGIIGTRYVYQNKDNTKEFMLVAVMGIKWWLTTSQYGIGVCTTTGALKWLFFDGMQDDDLNLRHFTPVDLVYHDLNKAQHRSFIRMFDKLYRVKGEMGHIEVDVSWVDENTGKPCSKTVYLYKDLLAGVSNPHVAVRPPIPFYINTEVSDDAVAFYGFGFRYTAGPWKDVRFPFDGDNLLATHLLACQKD